MRPALWLVPVLALAGCGHEKQSTLAPESARAEDIADLWWWLLGISAVVFAVVVMLVLAAVLRARGRRAAAPGEPRWAKGLLLVGGALVPGVVLVVLFAANVHTLAAASAEAHDARLEVVVTGRQWFWDVRYPQSGAATSNEIHLPLGVPVRLRVRTVDVIHSLWIPRLDRKIDMIPGSENSIAFTPQRVGIYRGQCAEFCGIQHANMALLVYVEPRNVFTRWLAREARPATAPRTARERRGHEVFSFYGCAGCHTVAGTDARGDVGPDLTHLASRTELAAGTIPNTEGYLAGWIADPQHTKPGAKMPAIPLTGADLQALVAYLESLR
jgi:cytochrome c oxidase subunit 2